MKRLWFVLVLILAVASLLGSACGGGGEEGGATATPTSKPTATPTKTATGETLSDILGKAGDIANVKYDMIMTTPDQEQMASKVWLKGKKMRMESTVEGEDIITLVDGDAQVMYIYYPSQNQAMQMSFTNAPESDIESTEAIEQYDPEIIGTETIDGKVCLVVVYTVEGMEEKAWIWKDKGFPIRVETTTSEGVTIIEWKNIDFGNIPDSTFQLPAGVEIMEFPFST